MLAVAVLLLCIATTAADPITLNVVEASPRGANNGPPSIFITVDNDGRRTLAQFTNEHVGEVIEVRGEGRLLMKARLRTAILGGQIEIGGSFGSDEVLSLASRLAISGKIEVNATPP
jgi:preprotein translocase subunit SecD